MSEIGEVPSLVQILSRTDKFTAYTCSGKWKNGNACKNAAYGTHTPAYCSQHFEKSEYGFAYISRGEANLLAVIRMRGMIDKVYKFVHEEMWGAEESEEVNSLHDSEEEDRVVKKYVDLTNEDDSDEDKPSILRLTNQLATL
jgi:hypothetical protein